jgi:hypothetical protein
MDGLRQTRGCRAGIAVAAMLALAVAPALSWLTGAWHGSSPSSQICSATKPISQGPAGGTGSPIGVQHEAGCALCAFGMAALPAPPGAGVMALVSDPSPRVAPASADASKSSREWAHAPPRGPPASV